MVFDKDLRVLLKTLKKVSQKPFINIDKRPLRSDWIDPKISLAAVAQAETASPKTLPASGPTDLPQDVVEGPVMQKSEQGRPPQFGK